jgi:hypothetical protein
LPENLRLGQSNGSFLQTLKICIKGCCFLTPLIVVFFLIALLFCLFLVFAFVPYLFSHFTIIMPCYCHALLALVLCCSCALLVFSPCYYHALLVVTLCFLSCIVVPRLTLVPCKSHILLSYLATFYYLTLLLSHLVTRTLLPYCCCPAIMHCYLALAPCYSPFSSTSRPPPIVVLLPCYLFSCLITMLCQLVVPPHSLLQVEELEATPTNFIQ